jgi:signal transduction histidine kinase
MKIRFNPIDVSIVIDNLVSNARRAKASKISFEISEMKGGMEIRVTDNGRGLTKEADVSQIFEMGYTTSGGSGLGLYHVRQVLSEMGGSIEVGGTANGTGISFLIKVSAPTRAT